MLERRPDICVSVLRPLSVPDRGVFALVQKGYVSTQDLRDGMSFPGQLDGRPEEVGPRQLPIEPVRLSVAPNFPRDGDPLTAWRKGWKQSVTKDGCSTRVYLGPLE